MNKYQAVAIFFCLFSGCAVDPLEDRNQITNVKDTTINPEITHAWLWTYSDQTDSLLAYHTIDKRCWESFIAEIEPGRGIHKAGLIGGGIYPTIWFQHSNKISAFTNGILDHGDHGHIVHPQAHVQRTFGTDFRILDICVSPERKQVFICGTEIAKQDSSTIISIDFLSGDTIQLTHPHPVSYIITGKNTILVGNRESVTATLLQRVNGTYVSTIATDTLVTDGIYHNNSGTAFLAGQYGVVVADMLGVNTPESIDYGGNGRITTFLASPGSDFAFGLYGTDTGFYDRVIVVDMKKRNLNHYTITGASVTNNTQTGTVALSDDGTVVILADHVRPVVYRFTISDGTVEQTTAPDTACPVACNWDGTRVWALARGKAYQVSFELNSLIDSIDVPDRTNWIMVSSFSDNSALFDSNDHTF